MDNVWQKVLEVAKAIASGIAVGIAVILTMLQGDQDFTALTLSDWLWVALAVLASYGITWSIPNRPKRDNAA